MFTEEMSLGVCQQKNLISLDIYQSYDETSGVLFLPHSAVAITKKLRTTRVLNPSTAIWSTDSRPECGVGIARPSLRLLLVVDSPDTCRLTKSGLNTSNNCNCYKPLPLQNKVYTLPQNQLGDPTPPGWPLWRTT